VDTPWRTELLEHLNASRNLIQLWTDTYAAKSRWVTEEIARFDTIANGDPQRRILPVGLEGSDPQYQHIQGIAMLDRAAQYKPENRTRARRTSTGGSGDR
jgi:hypothetical protein